MRWAVLSLLALTLLGCSREAVTPSTTTPLSPSVPTSVASNSLSGMVLEETGGCIDAATVEVVRGQAVGRRITQETPCGYWDYGGGFVFNDLTADVELTIRASAPGYAAQEKTVLPSSRPVFITLAKTQ
jgi:hypothetical protein